MADNKKRQMPQQGKSGQPSGPKRWASLLFYVVAFAILGYYFFGNREGQGFSKEMSYTKLTSYIEAGAIDKIDVNLPIYHETTEAVLQVGVGHLEGSSLPTGTKNTHAVLSGHRGLPSAKLFSDLDQLEVGDTFLVRILDQTFAYQVDQINIVLPQDTGHLGIVPGEEYCTLITCTPYGVNTHRMMVRGRRVDYSEEVRLIVPADATKYAALMVAPFIGGPVIVLILIVYLIMPARRRTTAKRMARNMIEESRTEIKNRGRNDRT